MALGVSVGGGAMVNANAGDTPPPGAGLKTSTDAVPAVVKSVASIDARTVVVLTTVVGRALPFHLTIDNASKPVPVTVSDNSPLPARALVGDNAVTVGAGFGIATNVVSALKTRILGIVALLPKRRVSVTGRPVCCNAFSTVPTLA